MIRPATPDDASEVSPLFILAMGHIAGILANSERNEDAIPLLEMFFTRDYNQYSYINTLVFEIDKKIIGFVTGYDGALLDKLRQPIIEQVRKSQPDFAPGDETEAGEYYLDCIAISTAYHGKGIGKKLISAFCEKADSLGFRRVGLIVDFENSETKIIYEKLGFQTVGERDFLGHKYFHMLKAN